MRRESLPCGGPRPDGALTCCQGDPAPSLPTGGSSGCSQMGAVGCGDTVGHSLPVWGCLAQARLVGTGCLSQRVPHSTSTACAAGDCAGPGLDRGNWDSAGARLAQVNTHTPGYIVRCNGSPTQRICWHCRQSSPAQPPTPACPSLPLGFSNF